MICRIKIKIDEQDGKQPMIALEEALAMLAADVDRMRPAADIGPILEECLLLEDEPPFLVFPQR